MKSNAVRAVAQANEKEARVLWDDGSGRREEADEDRKPLAARLPKSLHDYVTQRAGKGHGEITRALEDIIRFHRKLMERLTGERVRLQRYALDENLAWPAQAPEVLGRLITRALEEHERRRK